jgi:myo-inositol-1-phosphate synthase
MYEKELKDMDKIKIVIIGVENCASSLVQGIHYYTIGKSLRKTPLA